MRNLPALVVVFLAVLPASASEPMALWPNGAPGDAGDIGVERDLTVPSDGLAGGMRVVRLGNVSTPTLTLYLPPPD